MPSTWKASIPGIADWLRCKIELRQNLEAAYASRDEAALGRVIEQARAIVELCRSYGEGSRPGNGEKR